MTVKSITKPLSIFDITVMSNATSVQARGTKITKLVAGPELKAENPVSIHIDLAIHEKQALPDVLTATEELGLILKPQDALELGLMLLTMGLEDQSKDYISTILDRLTLLIAEIN